MKELHIIPHSHWDREWYMSFEQHRARLVELFDTLIEIMDKNPDYKYYHMDGQFIVIEDYLQIKPYMRERLFKLIREDRIQIGPWYVLQDEYLTSGEANVRNMLYGLKLCREIGAKPVMVGYFPDSFGNISQAPQILQGFDIDKAVFGRGIGDVGFDNQVLDNGVTNPSEIIWQSPDGSKVTSVMFCNWYNNANELPVDEKEAKEVFESVIKKAEECALTPYLLGMNGCDHQPVQTDLTKAIKTAQKVISDIKIKHSNFKEYFEAIMPYAKKFPTIVGELNSQRTNGICKLINTASTHIPLKQKNHKAQNLLEQVAEPMSVMAFENGDTYRSDMLLYSWKTLMENHPHDSICSCSCDEVTREMDIRFDKAIQSGEYVRDEARDFIVKNINTQNEKNIVVFHTNTGKTTAVVKAYVDYDKDAKIKGITVYDNYGEIVPSSFKELGETFTYTLPKDAFRQVKYVNRVEVNMLVTATGIGYETYNVVNEKSEIENLIKVNERGAENDDISFVIEDNGSITLKDKRNRKIYRNLNIYEDTGDKGEGYNYIPMDGDKAITTENDTAKISVKEKTPFYVTFEVKNKMEIPVGMKNGIRSKKTKKFEIKTYVTLTYGVGRLDIKTKFDNETENHRIRATFIPKIKTDVVYADGQFDLVEREIKPYKKWINPSYCQRHQAFFALEDDKKGLLVASRGLHEYEILRDGKNTMALTLLRCVGEVGDWGIFPTPDMQCKGEQTLCYSIVPYSIEDKLYAYALGREFSNDRFYTAFTDGHSGTLSPSYNLLKASPWITMSACKKAENSDSIILRLYNTDDKPLLSNVTVNKDFKKAYLTNLDEKRIRELYLCKSNGEIDIDIGAKKIVTIELI